MVSAFCKKSFGFRSSDFYDYYPCDTLNHTCSNVCYVALCIKLDTTTKGKGMRIAILDYFVIPNNAIGNCDRHIANGLCSEHEFTVFAVDFDNPNPERIKFVRVPALRRPLFLLFLTYHLLVPVIFWWHCLRNRIRFDIVQSVESNTVLGGLVYAHFCHNAYLKTHWTATKPSGLRGAARWLDHKLHALLEPMVFRRAHQIVVPSKGLGTELEATFPAIVRDKVAVIPNPIAVEKMQRPSDFDRAAFRQSLGISPDDLTLIFLALGHFERKGLGIILEAMRLVANQQVKLIVVGGTSALIAGYQSRAQSFNISDQVKFVGMQKDVRPYLWASDIFAFPSAYETFSLVTFEAAAAGLPLLVSHLHGVEDLLRDEENGWLVQRDPADIAARLQTALSGRPALITMGERAAASAQLYNVEAFVQNWRARYEEIQRRQQVSKVAAPAP